MLACNFILRILDPARLSNMSLCVRSFEHIWAIEDTKAYHLSNNQGKQRIVKFGFCQVENSLSNKEIYICINYYVRDDLTKHFI